MKEWDEGLLFLKRKKRKVSYFEKKETEGKE